MATGWWLQRILWIDGIAGCSVGIFVLVFRQFLAGLYALPLELVTFVGFANAAYSAFSLSLAAQKRRRVGHIVALAAANYFWAAVCVWLAIRFANRASALGLAQLLFEGAFVATLATIEWRRRWLLAEGNARRR